MGSTSLLYEHMSQHVVQYTLIYRDLAALQRNGKE